MLLWVRCRLVSRYEFVAFGEVVFVVEDCVLFSLWLEGEWIAVNNVRQLEAARKRLSS